MQLFIVAAILASATAAPSGVLTPVAVAAPSAVLAPVAVSSQYHAQDELGQYSYGYSNELSARNEIKTVDGITRGGYSYIDAEGKLQSVAYSADAVNGFRVAASNLPVAPVAPAVAPLPQPLPVQDTPEVAEAKTRHLAALEEAKTRAAAAPAEEVVVKTVETPAEEVVVKTVETPAAVVKTAPIVQTLPFVHATPYLAAPAWSGVNYIGYPTAYAAPWVGAPFVVAAPVEAKATAPVEAKAAPEEPKKA